MLAPLLVLFGVKFGIINTMTDRLLQDPRSREIISVGSGKFGQAWFASITARDDVAFVIPRTRSIAATIRLRVALPHTPNIVFADLIPTAPGDPLIGDLIQGPLGLHSIILSESAAEKLKSAGGDKLMGFVNRTVSGRPEVVKAELQVMSVLPHSKFGQDAAFVSIDFLAAVEDFRDGRSVPILGWSGMGTPSVQRQYAGFRLYARSVFDVPNLRAALAAQNVAVATRADDIELVQSLDKDLSAVFWIIAGVGVTGYLMSLGASVWANVERKRRELGVLRLVGFSTVSIVFFPVLQAGFVALLGSGVASTLYWVIQEFLNSLFAERIKSGELVCQLAPHHFAVSLLVTMFFSVFASLAGGYKAAHIEPVEGLRDT